VTKSYDIIGDVHGCGYQLEDLLVKLGYFVAPWSGAYYHPERTAVFVGDLIDRGPSQLRVLEIVKAMVDEGTAQIVMGNHEFNALAYATKDPEKPGSFLRPHNEKNARQHEAFLEQLTPEQRTHYLEWFLTLPLWLDLGELRVVHACWHQPSVDLIEHRLGGNSFTSVEDLIDAARTTKPATPLYKAIEVTLKGPELDLEKYDAEAFQDKDKILRSKARVKWWHGAATTLRELAEVPKGSLGENGQPYGELLETLVDEGDRSFSYSGTVPVFYGHYWRAGVPVEHEDWTRTTACVDFSAVRGGTMVAYRWNGERQIDPLHYHPHGKDLINR
jgi:hypothetical protein